MASSINVKLEEGEEEGEEKVVVEEVDISSVQAREGLILKMHRSSKNLFAEKCGDFSSCQSCQESRARQ